MSVKTSEDIEDVRGTRPSSPRRFFARLYGHLETEEDKSDPEKRSSLAEKITSGNETINVFPAENPTGRLMDCDKVRRTADSEFPRDELNVSVSVSSSSRRLDLPHKNKESLSLSVEEVTQARLLMFREASASFLPIVYPHLRTSGLAAPSAGQPTRLPGYEKFPRFDNDVEGHLNGFSAFFARRRRRETRPRRQRTTFSGQQTARLEFEYHRGEYITRGRRFELAESLSLTETQIKIWFQNRRAKDKRIEKARLDQHYRNIVVSNGLLPTPVYAGVTADFGDLSFCKNTKYIDDCHIVMPGEETTCSTSVTRENEESGGGDSITSSGSISSSSNSGIGGGAEDIL